jgi:hypothetical protein
MDGNLAAPTFTDSVEVVSVNTGRLAAERTGFYPSVLDEGGSGGRRRRVLERAAGRKARDHAPLRT